MQTTTTTTTSSDRLTLDYKPTPAFTPLQPGETRIELGHRACLFVLAHGNISVWRLDDETLDACVYALRQALCAKGLDGNAAETLSGVLAALRSEEAYRAQQQPQAEPEPVAQPQQPQAQPRPGGGSKVPRVPRKPQGGPSTALPVPGAQPKAPVPVLRPVAPLTADADLF